MLNIIATANLISFKELEQKVANEHLTQTEDTLDLQSNIKSTIL